MFDVYTMADSQHGVRLMNTSYSIPGMAAGASYSQSFQLDLAPDIYSVILVIDPYHKLKQATQNAKKYLMKKIKASCDGANSVLHMPASAGATGAAPTNPGSSRMLNPQPLPPKQGKTGNAGLPAVQLPAIQK